MMRSASCPPAVSFMARECLLQQDMVSIGRQKRPVGRARQPAAGRSCSPRRVAAPATSPRSWAEVSRSRAKVSCFRDELESLTTASVVSVGSADAVVSKSVKALRVLQSAADATPLSSKFRPALDAEVKETLNIAWEALDAQLHLECLLAPKRRFGQTPRGGTRATIGGRCVSGSSTASTVSAVRPRRLASSASSESCICVPDSPKGLSDMVERALLGTHSAHFGDIG